MCHLTKGGGSLLFILAGYEVCYKVLRELLFQSSHVYIYLGVKTLLFLYLFIYLYFI